MNKLFLSRRFSPGMSIPAVLIGVGVFSTLTAATLAVMSNITISQATAKFRAQIDPFQDEVRATLNSVTACVRTFADVDLNPPAPTYQVTEIRDSSDRVAYRVGESYGENNFTLQSITAANYVQSLENPEIGTLNFTLHLQARGEVLGGSVLVRTIRILTRINAAGNMSSCIALPKMSEGMWQYTVPTPPNTDWNISYLDGRVGIGGNPSATLSVSDSTSSAALMVESTFANSSAVFETTGASGGSKLLVISQGGSKRWQFGADNVAETGGNLGSDFRIQRFEDSGALVNASLIIRRDNGFIGINDRNPAYHLDVIGSLRITGTPYRDGGDIEWNVPSDSRLKDIKGHYEYGLEAVSKLNPIRFRFKKENPVGAETNREFIGVVAHEVQSIIPEAVTTNPVNGYLALNTTPIFWALVNSVKELKNESAAIKDWICAEDHEAEFCRPRP